MLIIPGCCAWVRADALGYEDGAFSSIEEACVHVVLRSDCAVTPLSQ